MICSAKCFGTLRRVLDGIDADHSVGGGKYFTEMLGLGDGGVHAIAVKQVQERFSHFVGWVAMLIQGVSVRIDVEVDGASDASHVRHLGEIISPHATPARGPDEDVVGQMLDHGVCLLLGRHETFAEQCDVLVVPGVSVGDGRAVANAVDLVAIIPPGHDPRVGGGVVAQPPVGLSEVVDHDHLTPLRATLDDDLGLGELVGHGEAVGDKVPVQKRDGQDGNQDDGQDQSQELLLSPEFRETIGNRGGRRSNAFRIFFGSAWLIGGRRRRRRNITG